MKKSLKIFLISALLIMLLVIVFLFFNNNNLNKKLIGIWIADGTQYKIVIDVVDGEPIYADYNNSPYYLILDGEGKYTLELKNHKEVGTYSVNEQSEVILTSDEGLIIEFCQLIKKKRTTM